MFQQIVCLAALLALTHGGPAQDPVGDSSQPVTIEDHRLMETILSAEQRRQAPVPDEVVGALQSNHSKIAARAAFALGVLNVRQAVPQLCEIVEQHADAEVRRQAMHAVLAIGDPRSVNASIRALGSGDLVVRTLAASNLGRLRATEAIDPLLAVISREAIEGTKHTTEDQVAAIVALADIGSHEGLLPAAGAVKTGHRALGAALTYMFQIVSPKLAPNDEAVALVAVLAHPCTLLRRYAIQRLGQLRDPTTVSALEGRLAAEDDAGLRQLAEVSLQAVRGLPTPSEDAGALAAVAAQWREMSATQRGLIGAVGVGTLVLVGAFLAWRMRRRRALSGEQWAEMTEPSEEFEDESEHELDAADDHEDDLTGEAEGSDDLLPGEPAFENEPDYEEVTAMGVDPQFETWDEGPASERI